MTTTKKINIANIEKSVTKLTENETFSKPELISPLMSDRSAAAVQGAKGSITSSVTKLKACVANFDRLLHEVATTFTDVDHSLSVNIASSTQSGGRISTENNKYDTQLEGK